MLYIHDESILMHSIGEQSVPAVMAGGLTSSSVSIAIPPLLQLLPFDRPQIAWLPQPQRIQPQGHQRRPPRAP